MNSISAKQTQRTLPFLGAVFVVLLLAALVPAHARATDTVYSGQCGESAYWTYDSDGVLSITGEGAVVKKGYSKFDNFAVLDDIGMNRIYIHSLATSIVVGEGITSLEAGLFKNYTLVERVTLPSTLGVIDEQTFADCRKVGEVSFTGTPTLQAISSKAFYDCKGLASFAIPASVTAIGDEAFSGCAGLTKLTAAKSSALASVGASAFEGCSALKTVSIGSAKLSSIGAGAFKGCTALKSIAFPSAKAFSEMGADAFESGTFKAKVTKAAAKKKRKLAVKWAKTQGATSYKLYYKAAGAKKYASKTLAATSTTLKKLKTGKKYKIYVEAYLGKVKLAKSAVKTSTKA